MFSERSASLLSLDQEPGNEYCRGGYCPIHVGEIISNRYITIKKIGWGSFSTVWMIWDTIECKLGAMKVGKGSNKLLQNGIIEASLMNALNSLHSRDASTFPLPHIYNFFTLDSIFGRHPCMVMDYMSRTLLDFFMENDLEGLEMEVVKNLTSQLLDCLSYLHDHCHVIHSDIKPENILLASSEYDSLKQARSITQLLLRKGPNVKKRAAHQVYQSREISVDMQGWRRLKEAHKQMGSALAARSPSEKGVKDLVVKLGDLGTCRPSFIKRPVLHQTETYRAPECIVMSDVGPPTDIWSLGCVCYEMATGQILFDLKSNDPEEVRKMFHLSSMIDLLHDNDLSKLSSKLRESGGLSKWKEEDLESFSSLLKMMLRIEPGSRVTAAKARHHPWLSNTST